MVHIVSRTLRRRCLTAALRASQAMALPARQADNRSPYASRRAEPNLLLGSGGGTIPSVSGGVLAKLDRSPALLGICLTLVCLPTVPFLRVRSSAHSQPPTSVPSKRRLTATSTRTMGWRRPSYNTDQYDNGSRLLRTRSP